MNIHVVESQFQIKIAHTISNSKIIFIPQNKKRFFIILKAFYMAVTHINNRKVIIHDHRSWVLILLVLCRFFLKNYKNNLYIGDDGAYSVLVDFYKEDYLFWRVNFFKLIFMKPLTNKILQIKRYQTLIDARHKTSDGSIYKNYYKNLKKNKTAFTKKNIFIDQTHVINSLGKKELCDLINFIKKIERVEIILHPNTPSKNVFSDYGIPCRYSNDLDSEIMSMTNNQTLYSFFSTSIINAIKLNKNVKIIYTNTNDSTINSYAEAFISLLNIDKVIKI